jgi:dihydrofolate reductase
VQFGPPSWSAGGDRTLQQLTQNDETRKPPPEPAVSSTHRRPRASSWPYVTEDPIAERLNGTRKHVASTTLEAVEWNNSTLITGDVADYVATLKSQEGPEIQVQGSPGLIQTLLEHDLIDEFRIWIFPVVIGTGKRLFGVGTILAGLKLVDSKVSKTGVTINTYERAGEIDYGSFAFDEPTEAEIKRRRRFADS